MSDQPKTDEEIENTEAWLDNLPEAERRKAQADLEWWDNLTDDERDEVRELASEG